MAFQVQPLSALVERTGLNVLVHGPPGSGKTTLLSTVPDPSRLLILSAEAGLRSILRTIPEASCARISSTQDVREAFAYLKTPEARAAYDWIALDSLSEVAGLNLNEQLKATKDGRKAYGQMADEVGALVRAFRDLPYHVVLTSAQARTQDDTGALIYGPSQPGQSLNTGTKSIAYLMDEVWAAHVVQRDDGNGQLVPRHMLQCKPDGRYECKSRSGCFALYEPPNLAALLAKLDG